LRRLRIGHACRGITRRRILQAGGAGLLGLDLPTLLAAEAVGNAGTPRAKSVTFHFCSGDRANSRPST